MTRSTKSLLISALLLAASATVNAQTVNTPQLIPMGAWPLCNAGISIPGCTNPGYEPFLLLVKANSEATQSFEYDILGTAQDGIVRHLHGWFNRADGVNGGTTTHMVNIGILTHVTITVWEHAVLAVQTAQF